MHEWSLKIFPNSALDFEIKYPQIDQEIESEKNEIYLRGRRRCACLFKMEMHDGIICPKNNFLQNYAMTNLQWLSNEIAKRLTFVKIGKFVKTHFDRIFHNVNRCLLTNFFKI